MNKIIVAIVAIAVAIIITLFMLHVDFSEDSNGQSAWLPRAPLPVPTGQLGTAVVPLHYHLDLTLLPEQSSFSGTTQIDLSVNQPTDTFFIHGKGLRVSSSELLTAQHTLTANYEQVDGSGVVKISLPRVVSGNASLTIKYEADYSTSLDSIYKVEESGQHYVFSQMEAISARMSIPSFDEPLFKTPFDISVTTEANNSVISNTPEISAEKLPNGLIKHTFATTKPLPTYLLAFAVGEFDVIEWPAIPPNDLRAEAIPLRGIAAKGKGEQLLFALDNTQAILEALESYFGLPYPYQKLDLIAAPDFAFGAMENAGAIVYRETLLLLDDQAPVSQLRAYGVVHAHELGHQWFGNLVTPKWWDDIWLNEAFATWVAYKAAHQWRPDLEFDRTLTMRAHGAMAVDARSSARQIRNPIATNDDIMNAFDGITYRKGGGVLQMFESYLGEHRFRDGVRLHMKRHAWGNADINDFLQSLADGSGTPEVIPAFKSFLYQSGVPTVSVNQQCDTSIDKLLLQQSRYVPMGITEGDPQQWQIPFCFRSQDGKQCLMLAQPKYRQDWRCQEWLMPNAEAAGYYRWQLDDDGWQTLFEQAEQLSASELISLGDNLFAAYLEGAVSSERLLAGYQVLSASDYWDVAAMPLSQLQRLQHRLLNNQAPTEFTQRVARYYQPHFNTLGFDANTRADLENPNATALLRHSVIDALALTAKDPAIRSALKRRLNDYLGSRPYNTRALDPNLVGIAMIAAVQDSDETYIWELKELGLTSTNGLLRQQVFTALGQIDDRLLGQLLVEELLLSTEVRSNEAQQLLASFIQNPVLQDFTWQWLKDNLDAMLLRYSSFSIARIVSVAAPFCSTEQRDDMSAFFSANQDKISGAPRQIAETAEIIDQCVALRANKADEFIDALSR
ncbi:M1 family metallopeptidase [Neiella sp. HB171785]|uniref:Aminopeptidase n=1 Tax=Neiella litorisoli TaxID=2771431 RepID=A0A8J6QSC8_9GAMM|nr:M1 family metallopeptidase [Neiella litorisoli]MBD1391161.1 M1 family metallopeptidase [Neiella litorisoli]